MAHFWKISYSYKDNENHYDIVRNRFDLIDDDKNKFENVSRSGFISHRHSQSVLSILLNWKTVNSFLYESEWSFR